MKDQIEEIINDCMDDINKYLESDVPLECYQKDIDSKLYDMKLKILELFY